MCTAVSFRKRGFYFGRTLDNDSPFGEEVVIAPRGFYLRGAREHYAIIGMATVREGYPLYYDGMNEKGLCMAGLNFPGNAGYNPPSAGAENVPQYNLLPHILGSCASVAEAARALKAINLTDEPFSADMPAAPLHWMISDGQRDLVAECVEGHMQLYENTVGVLTNNPPFPVQYAALSDYMALTSGEPRNAFCPALGLKPYCKGMGAMGLPGDYSSHSRFVRAAFVRNNYELCEGEDGESALARILSAVEVPRGCCRSGDGWEVTLYSSRMDAAHGVYSYMTYKNRAAGRVALGGVSGDALVRFTADT